MGTSYRDIITIKPGGRACVRGLRIAVHDVLSYLGLSERVHTLAGLDKLDGLPEEDTVHLDRGYDGQRARLRYRWPARLTTRRLK